MAAVRQIVYDSTHLVHRRAYHAPSGIDRVDMMFADHLQSRPGIIAGHYGRRHLQTFGPARLRRIVSDVQEQWRDTVAIDADEKFAAVRSWLKGVSSSPLPASAQAEHGLEWHFKTKVLPYFRYMHVSRPDRDIVPERAIYLNVAQHSLEKPMLFEWLRRRRDVDAVFFLHDLLPLDYPEFWWGGHEDLFRRRVDVILDHASALITSSDSVRDRVRLELCKRGKSRIPILSCHLPSALDTTGPVGHAPSDDLSSHPYFVVLGTIEPRKNHLLLFNIWRRFVSLGRQVPKLIVVGRRGWENQQTIGMLERCPGLADHVLAISGLSAPAVRELLAHARGLLFPSFAEGFGLPLVEALGLGTPVLASDIPVFHEVTQDKAIFTDPVDGLGWSAGIEALADPTSATSRHARMLAKQFSPQSKSDYFAKVDAFLDSL